ncbi:hypothetical protein BCT30_10195 [Enterovibrio norvegicus]|nr:hypothetical protein BCU47_07625 [Enterovibrio norvegicus]PMI35001.1 hypothetical protein BCU46_20305 [Enterovibrio norvegicus]PMN53742.1 hypothetical protein BCT30_10195 [Enterovibrio norvegicus]
MSGVVLRVWKGGGISPSPLGWQNLILSKGRRKEGGEHGACIAIFFLFFRANPRQKYIMTHHDLPVCFITHERIWRSLDEAFQRLFKA